VNGKPGHLHRGERVAALVRERAGGNAAALGDEAERAVIDRHRPGRLPGFARRLRLAEERRVGRQRDGEDESEEKFQGHESNHGRSEAARRILAGHAIASRPGATCGHSSTVAISAI